MTPLESLGIYYMLQQATNIHKSSGALFFVIEVCFHVSEEVGHPPKVLTFHIPIDAQKNNVASAQDGGHKDAQSGGTRAFVDSASPQASLRSLMIIGYAGNFDKLSVSINSDRSVFRCLVAWPWARKQSVDFRIWRTLVTQF